MIKRVCLYCSKDNYNLLPALIYKRGKDEKVLQFKIWRFHAGIAWNKDYKGDIEWNFIWLPPEMRGKDNGKN